VISHSGEFTAKNFQQIKVNFIQRHPDHNNFFIHSNNIHEHYESNSLSVLLKQSLMHVRKMNFFLFILFSFMIEEEIIEKKRRKNLTTIMNQFKNTFVLQASIHIYIQRYSKYLVLFNFLCAFLNGAHDE